MSTFCVQRAAPSGLTRPCCHCRAWDIREACPQDAYELSLVDQACASEGSGGWSSAIFESTMSQLHATVLVTTRGADDPPLMTTTCSTSSNIATATTATPLTEGSSVAGFISGIYVADELQIENLAVHPRHRGQGLGLRLLQALLERHGLHSTSPTASSLSSSEPAASEQERVPCCLLEVKEGNVAALALYQKFGFKIVGRRKKFYADGSAGLMMALNGDI